MDALGHLSPFPKGAAPTFILSPSRNTDPIKLKAKAPNLHLQDSNAISPTSHRTEIKLLYGALALPATSSHSKQAPSCQLHTSRSTPSPQPCNFHKSDTFTPTTPSSSQVSDSTNSVSSPKTKNLFHLVLSLLPGFWEINPHYQTNPLEANSMRVSRTHSQRDSVISV